MVIELIGLFVTAVISVILANLVIIYYKMEKVDYDSKKYWLPVFMVNLIINVVFFVYFLIQIFK